MGDELPIAIWRSRGFGNGLGQGGGDPVFQVGVFARINVDYGTGDFSSGLAFRDHSPPVSAPPPYRRKILRFPSFEKIR